MVQFADIYPHEMQVLLEALRRDLRSERLRAAEDPAAALIHRQNERLLIRLLELFNPRGAHREEYRLRAG